MNESTEMILGATKSAAEQIALAAAMCLRASMLAVLVVLEPIVGFALYVLALLGLLVTLMLKFADARGHFPFWTMLGISLSFALAHLAYHGVIRLLTGRHRYN